MSSASLSAPGAPMLGNFTTGSTAGSFGSQVEARVEVVSNRSSARGEPAGDGSQSVLDGYAQVKADEAMGSGTSFFEHKSGSRGSGGDENGSYFERQKVFIGVLLYLLVGGTVLAGPWADSGACPADGMAGAGELTVTNTTSADPDAARGVNMPAPVYLGFSPELPSEGISGQIVNIAAPCGGELTAGEPLLLCDTCPPQLNPEFDSSTLSEKVLLTDPLDDERVWLCGLDQLSESLRGIGLIAIGYGVDYDYSSNILPCRPGFGIKPYRLGSDRASADDPNAVPFVDLELQEVVPLIHALDAGKNITVELTPTLANPWRNIMCGLFIPVRAVLVCAYLTVSERALWAFADQLKRTGLTWWRLDSIALLAEVFVSLSAIPCVVDPFLAFYWGGAAYGLIAAGFVLQFFFSASSTVLLAAYWNQMVSMKGLSSTKATTATGKVSIVCSVLLMAISAYMWFVEALLDQAGWLEARIPGLNSFSYGSGVYLATMVQLFTALYFLGSSARAYWFLVSASDMSNSRRVLLKAMQGRVAASGVLMLTHTAGLTIALQLMFNPFGYVVNVVVNCALGLANSTMQIDSFAPPDDASIGPLRAALTSTATAMRELWRHKSGLARIEEVRREQEARVFETLSLPPTRRNSSVMFGSIKFVSGALVVPSSDSDNSRRSLGMRSFTLFGSSSSSNGGLALVPPLADGEAGADTPDLIDTLHGSRRKSAGRTSSSSKRYYYNPEDEKPAHRRAGVSLAFLEALVAYHKISPGKKTFMVCDDVVKPATTERRCTYIDLLKTNPNTPDNWLGEPMFFLSHWWGYDFVDVVAMIAAHEARRKAEGMRPTYYFFDIFVLNQHSLTMNCTATEDGFQVALIDSLKLSLVACGSVLLACGKGSGEHPGWKEPAPLTRIWCLFEVYVSLEGGVPISVQFAPAEEKAFLAALGKGGLAEVERALAGIDIKQANASVQSDIARILEAVEKEVGIESFNASVHQGLMLEYRELAEKATFR